MAAQSNLEVRDPLSMLAMGALSVLLILSYSRFIENIGIPFLFMAGSGALLLYALAFGTAANRFKFMPMVPLFVLSIWMIFSSVLGMWPRGSLEIFLNRWCGALLMFVVIVMIPKSLRDHRLIMSSMAWATVVILLMVRFQGGEVGSRLAIDDSSLGNPNDLALYLVVALPFCAAYAIDKERKAILRVGMIVVFAYGLLTTLRTGSRMGLIALAAQVVVLFIAGTGKVRFFVASIAALTSLASLVILPAVIRDRYLTWTEPVEVSGKDASELQKAAGSAESRMELLKLSIKVTGQHPFLGVGPGEFADAARKITARPGVKGFSQQTHNTYTQLSSECGVIPALLYIAILVFTLRTTVRIRSAVRVSPKLQPLGAQALCLYIATVGYAACAFFGSLAYTSHLLLLCGFAVCLDILLKSAGASHLSPTQPPAPPPVRLPPARSTPIRNLPSTWRRPPSK